MMGHSVLSCNSTPPPPSSYPNNNNTSSLLPSLPINLILPSSSSSSKQQCFAHLHPPFLWVCPGEVSGNHGRRRREALFQMAFSLFTIPAFLSNALAADDGDFRLYTDDVNKFQIYIPQDWQVGAGEPTGFKSVTAFYPQSEDASNSSVSVVISGLGPDFTRMESFGKVEAFAETLVGGLDRSWQRPPGVAAKLIDSKAANGIYYIEYTLQNPGESRKHLISALGMAFNGWYNRLYTVTGQFVDEESDKYGSKIQKVVSSFKFI